MQPAAEFFNWTTDLLVPALVSAVVTLTITFIFKWAEIWRSADVIYTFEQKKRIKDSIGKHVGTLLETSEKVSGRLENLSGNFQNNWMQGGTPRSNSGYYFNSTVQRLMNFYEVVYRVEREAIALDARHADSADYEFLNFVALFRWILSDVHDLFSGTPYDLTQETDHLYADNLKEICARYSRVSDRDSRAEEIQSFMDNPNNESLFRLLEGMKPNEQRLRWDRFQVLYLVILCFQDTFGHKRHIKSVKDMQNVASRVEHPRVLRNLVQVISKYSLSQSTAGQKLMQALEAEHRAKTGAFLGGEP